MPELYIAMYKPRFGNYEHWALCLKDDGDWTIFEVIGQHGEFKRNSLPMDPESSLRHKRNILVGTINKEAIPELLETMENVEIDNETTEWNCQDYVLEALDKLVEECVIDEDDEDYKKGTELAKGKYFGAM